MGDTAAGNRVIILGCPGSGKSTLAGSLHKLTGLPLYHLDNIWWKPDRTHITREEFDGRLEEIMRGEKWIIDGDFSRTYEPRFISCDTVIFLDLSEEDCMNGIKDRVGKKRPDIPWTASGLEPDLVELVKRYRAEERPKLRLLIEKYPDKNTLVFKTRDEAREWLSGL